MNENFAPVSNVGYYPTQWTKLSAEPMSESNSDATNKGKRA